MSLRSRDRVRSAVVGLTALALVLRVADLGTRVAHWDEGRVAYWVLRYAETGDWAYRPIVHGPFVQHAARASFALLGPSDFAARLPVALVGGLLPLVALLFRDWLDDREAVALAGVLALNPLLLYFSRFFRSDVPLAAFMLVALGCALRLHATGRPRYLYAGAGALALGVATKENALLYLLSWAGATACLGLLALALDAPVARRERLARWRRRVSERPPSWVWSAHAALALAVFLAVTVVMYAPRGGAAPVGLWTVFERPGALPAVVGRATLGSARRLVRTWVTGGLREHAYAPFLGHYLLVLVVGGLATVALAGYGAWVVVRSRLRPGACSAPGSRSVALASFGLLWGVASVVGYPYVADIRAPWLVVHAVVAFCFPAAVGLGALARRIEGARERADRRALARLALICVLLGGQLAGVVVLTSYTHPPARVNVVAQGAQPGGDLRPTLRRVERIAATSRGVDVLYYGRFATRNESVNAEPPAGAGWYRRLPFGWYTAAYGANVTNAREVSGMGPNPPPVVVAPGSARAELAGELPGYAAFEYAHTRLRGAATYRVLGYEYSYEGSTVVFFVDRDALAA
ncbi:MAG: flippase activity-associated protein Agl23 [Haloglomus sp.]